MNLISVTELTLWQIIGYMFAPCLGCEQIGRRENLTHPCIPSIQHNSCDVISTKLKELLSLFSPKLSPL